MGLPEMLAEHIEKPRLKDLSMDAERLDTAIKKFNDVLELADDDRMDYFLDIIKRKKDKAESILLNPQTPDTIKRECIGEMRALNDVYNWKKYYLNALVQAQKDLDLIKQELKTGERPEDRPNN